MGQIKTAAEQASRKYRGNIVLRETYTQIRPAVYENGEFKDWGEWANVVGRPLNKRGDAFSGIRLGVLSTRRVGSRVSQQRYSYFGPVNVQQRRIASACWHAHRDFMREVFTINPSAKIKTALATYDGKRDFERKFPRTAETYGMAGPAPIEGIGDACNCDEGAYPEFATENLTKNQTAERIGILRDLAEDIKAISPRDKSWIRYEERGDLEKMLQRVRRAERRAA
jgi:hypothetical protein